MFTPLLRVFEVFAISLTTLSEGDTILLYCTRMMVTNPVQLTMIGKRLLFCPSIKGKDLELSKLQRHYTTFSAR